MRLARLRTAVVATGIIVIGLGSAAVTNSIRTSRITHPKSGIQIVVPGKDGDVLADFKGPCAMHRAEQIRTSPARREAAFIVSFLRIP